MSSPRETLMWGRREECVVMDGAGEWGVRGWRKDVLVLCEAYVEWRGMRRKRVCWGWGRR